MPQNDDAACDFALAVQLGDTAAQFGADLHIGDIAKRHRHTARFGAQRDRAEIIETAEIARRTHHEFRFAHLDDGTACLLVACLDRAHDLAVGHSEGSHAVGVEHDLVLLDHAAHTGDLGDPRYSLQLVAQEPVLQAAQSGQIVAAAAVDQGILVNPSHTGCVGTKRTLDAVRQAVLDLVEIFEHARARPVEIGPVLKNYVDIAIAEKRITAHGLCSRHREHGRRQWIGNLVLHDTRGLPGIVGADNHLHVGQIGKRIDRGGPHCPEAGERQADRRQNHEKAVGDRTVNDPRDHWPVFRIETMRGPVLA